MREYGVVIDVKNGRALIEVTPAPGCGKSCSCAAVEGNARLRRVELDVPENARPGSIVTLEVNSAHLLASSAVVFLVPVLVLVGGVLGGAPLLGALGVKVNADMGMLLGGAVGFLAGLAGALVLARWGAKRGWLTPHIVEVTDPAS
jgi:positive regulator of sigma E activity